MNPIHRRTFLKSTALGATTLLFRPALRAAEPGKFTFDPTASIILAPDDPALWPQFREQLAAWRTQERQALDYSGALYDRPDFAWVPPSYACYFLMLCDERFYDAAAGRYLTQEWLEACRREFAGVDSVVLWHAYPRIGFDARNQYDFYREMPGGLPGLREVVGELHRAGLHVYVNYNPWDTGTRREKKGDLDMLCEIVGALDIDGIFLDTMKEGAADFRVKLDAVRPGVVLEGEGVAPVNRITDHHMSWGQKLVDSNAPGVVRNKWFERRHQMHHVNRRNHDRTPELQTAFMNGTGTMVWDNVFGAWEGYSEREKSLMRTILPIQRHFTALFSGERWTPLVPTNAQDIYASLWEGPGIRLWTLVNRAIHDAAVDLPGVELNSGEQLWDLVAGREVQSPRATIRSRGVGCFVAAQRKVLAKDFDDFLGQQHTRDQAVKWNPAFPAIQPRLKPVTPTRAHAPGLLPQGMAAVPRGPARLTVHYQTRECGWYESTPTNIENYSKYHKLTAVERDVALAPFAMDLTPVTNAQFAEFLRASGYAPKQQERFLSHWTELAPPAGQEDHPVVYIDVEDARAYAKWAGKRLPTEEEWQFAAQGTDGRKYPWGNFEPSASPDLCNGSGHTTTPVTKYPAGRSPFGIYDMCGNTWEWTESERSDGVNRFSIIRGGSHYKAMGSVWYTDGGPVATSFGAKFLHYWPGLDRCATIGFRCVVDLAESPPQS